MQWVVDIEEEDGLSDESTLIGPGVMDMNFDFNLQARKLHMRCMQRKSGLEIPVKRNAVLTW